MTPEEERQYHADTQEFDTLLRAVQDSKLDPTDKDGLRRLLVAAYRNLNGDPTEVKIKLLARVDWEQVKHSLTDSAKLSHIIGALGAIDERLAGIERALATPAPKPAPTKPFLVLLFDFLKDAKGYLTAIILAAIAFPNGGAVLKIVGSWFSR